MLITKEVEIIWNPKNVNWYKSKGYLFTKVGDKFIVPIPDVSIGCTEIVEVLCDYCNETITSMKYTNYINRNKKNVDKDCCINCADKKHKEVMEIIKFNNLGKTHYFVKQGIVKEKGYWDKRENRINEVDLYIKKYKTLDNYSINKDRQINNLKRNLAKHKENIYDIALELGYKIEDISTYKPNGWHDDFKKLEANIQKLIDKLGYFPSSQEIFQELKISSHIIEKHGGIYNIKRAMKYDDIHDLKDNSGFYNKSKFELWTANFLLSYYVVYAREVEPFDDRKFRSDFKIIVEYEHDIVEYYVEVWGYPTSQTDKTSIEYNKSRKEKERLYRLSNYNLISIEPEIFINKKYEEINQSLFNIFKDILNQDYKNIVVENYIPVCALTDKELLTEAMSIALDDNVLPSSKDLVKTKHGVYKEIIRRFNTYKNFARKFEKKTIYKERNAWTDINNLFHIFDHMINCYGKILTQKESVEFSLTDVNLVGSMHAYITNIHGGIVESKLKYFKNKLYIPEVEIEYLKNVSENKGRNIKGNVKPEHQLLAKQILEKYNNQMQQSVK